MHYCAGGQAYFSHSDGVGSTLSDQLCTRPIFSMIPSIFPPDSSPCAQPSVLTEKNLQTIEKPKAVFPRCRMAQSNSFLSGSSWLLTLIYLPQFGGFIASLSLFFFLLFVLSGNVKTMSMLLSADSWSPYSTGGRTSACSSCTWLCVLELWLCPFPP